MGKRKSFFLMAVCLVLFFAFYGQVSALETQKDVKSNDSSGGVEVWSEVIPYLGSVSSGDVVPDDLSGKKVNLAFVIDTTGSMSSYISGVVANLSQFVRYIESTGVSFRLSLIDYRDITCNEDTIVHTFDHSVWSQSTEQMIEEMQSLYVSGGGDYEETLIDALGYLVDDEVMTFNSDAAKFAIVLTDAPYKTDNVHGIENMDAMIGALQEKGIKVSVMTEDYCFSDYDQLVKATGGILCSVDNFSDTLMEYAVSIIRTTDDMEVDTSVRPVTSISADGPAAIRPDYVYGYYVEITPADASNQGTFWYVENGEIAEIISAEGTTCYVRGVSEGNTRLVAVSSDGGYTSAVDITVNKDAEISDNMITYKYDSVKDGLFNDGVKVIEYRVTRAEDIGTGQQNEIFSAMKGAPKTFAFAFSDIDSSVMYKWSFQGDKITDENQTVNFGVTINAGNEDILGVVEENVEKMDIHFDHNGTLPGEASVSVRIGDFFEEHNLYLYFYNAETGALELAAENVPVIDGYAIFPLSHCSDYILTSQMLRSLVPDFGPEEEGEEDEENEEDDDSVQLKEDEVVNASVLSPKTGENRIPFSSAIVGAAILVVLIGTSMLIMKNKDR